MTSKTSEFISDIYESSHKNSIKPQKIRKSPESKYEIFDEVEFSRGRRILGDMIVHGMMTSGGTDLDWLIEHRGGFVIFEFKGFHNDKINIPIGQMIAYENLHEKLNKATKCYLFVVGCDEIDFSNPDSPVWVFEIGQWKNGVIPKNTRDIYDDEQKKQNKYIVYRDHMEEITVEKLRELVDSKWKEFESISL